MLGYEDSERIQLFGALVSLLPNIENLRQQLLGQAGESRNGTHHASALDRA
jgi:hypothetical protein